MPGSLLLNLSRNRSVRRARFGGKAAGLGILMRHGFPTLSTLAVDLCSLRRFVRSRDPRLCNLTLGALVAHPDDRRALSHAVREALSETDTVDVLSAALPGLAAASDGRLVVRSSSVLEDSRETSLSGVFGTRTVSPDMLEVVRALAGVMAYWDNSRALETLMSLGFGATLALANGGMIQPHIDTAISGVLITPVSRGKSRGLLLEYSDVPDAVTAGVNEPERVFVPRGVATAATRSQRNVHVLLRRYRFWPRRATLEFEWGITRKKSPVFFQCRPLLAQRTLLNLSHDQKSRSLWLSAGRCEGTLRPLGHSGQNTLSGPTVVLMEDMNEVPSVLRSDYVVGAIARTGGLTSHGANLLRELCKPCLILTDRRLGKLIGRKVSLDSSSGSVSGANIKIVAGGGFRIPRLVRRTGARITRKRKTPAILQQCERAGHALIPSVLGFRAHVSVDYRTGSPMVSGLPEDYEIGSLLMRGGITLYRTLRQRQAKVDSLLHILRKSRLTTAPSSPSKKHSAQLPGDVKELLDWYESFLPYVYLTQHGVDGVEDHIRFHRPGLARILGRTKYSGRPIASLLARTLAELRERGILLGEVPARRCVNLLQLRKSIVKVGSVRLRQIHRESTGTARSVAALGTLNDKAVLSLLFLISALADQTAVLLGAFRSVLGHMLWQLRESRIAGLPSEPQALSFSELSRIVETHCK